MVATLILVAGALRRALQKLGRGLVLLGDAFSEAQEARRAAGRRYMDD